jgi:hypothetical protein
MLDVPLVEKLPPPAVVEDRLGDALREIELLRGLLRLSKRAEEYRQCDRRRMETDGDRGE